MSPLLILIIGVIIVISMIIVLRVNAFIALITAAMVVSLLSPGVLSEKMTRVAVAFGTVVGSIGIVIAMAAVIGKCLMDSGAADRIVRAFLRLLGEKRTPWALMGSGFVLSIPVFFDTVFYLLVPLARSLYKRTGKNYMVYLMAICAGGALTHTLVPPTPGPLFIANEFGIDLGLMIFMGVIVGIPTAVIAMIFCRIINHFVNVPMRSYSGQPEPEPIPDSELPPLWLSLLPVLLPVILISTNTIANVFARAEHVNTLTPRILNAQIEGNEKDARDLAEKLVNAKILSDFGDVQELTAKIQEAEIRENPADDEVLAQELIKANVFGDDKQVGPAQKAADITAVLGNANLALFLSAVISMFLVVWKRKISLRELTKSVDQSLMSGGIIILITAGGGAFGAMLQEAGIKAYIQSAFASSGQNVSLMIFIAAFAVASLLKIAQGSSTVAMITTSTMFAAMGLTTEILGCNFVYLALSIGGGALVGSWMNDSGFWIVARMGALTETEALKSWTVIAAVVGTMSFGFTLLLSRLFPLV
ncbi:MAG: SLC13 family permease [Sedimentisphaerales bacterium]